MTADTTMLVVCKECGRQRLGDAETGVWVAAPVGGYPVGALLSHGCCAACNEARYRATGLAWPPETSKSEQKCD